MGAYAFAYKSLEIGIGVCYNIKNIWYTDININSMNTNFGVVIIDSPLLKW